MQNTITTELCPLCDGRSRKFYQDQFLQCDSCKGIFRPKKNLPTEEAEKHRYEQHNNDVNDLGYQKFVSPITDAVFSNYDKSHNGLDFGSGPSSVISKLLRDKNYNINQFDPYFHNQPEVLNHQYDYIICCEVIEHFHFPYQEFKQLHKMLLPGGKLFCMTHLYSSEQNFDQWYYKNDFTHVFIFQKETIEWIKDEFNFSSVRIDRRFIEFIV